MLKNRTLIGIVLIVAAIGLCFGISPLFNTILASKTTIIRLKQDIPQGVQITGSMLEAVEVGSMNLPADMQNDPKKIIGKYSVTAMFAGDSFNDKKLSDTIDTSDSLLRQLKPNETAMSVTVKSLANGLSGKLQQGDIIQIVSVDEDDKAQIFEELQYVEVLATTSDKGSDRVIYLFGALMMSAGIVILLGITPEIITQDIMSLMSRQRSLKYRVAKAQGKVKQNRLQTAIMNIKNALIATRSENKFSLLISVSLIGICAGFLLAALLQNLLLIPIFSGICVILPYAYVNVLLSNYNRRISEELETALSIITTNYVSNDDIIYAVEQSIDYINPPVQQAFRKFLTQTKLINSNVKLAIEQLKGEINNEIFHEWCDSLIECQDNVTLKKTLQPITTKLSNVRIINAELRNMLMSPRREHVMMVFILLANYPILYFLNSDWFKVLTDTFVGQVVNSIVAIVVIVTVILAYKYTQPIQYKR